MLLRFIAAVKTLLCSVSRKGCCKLGLDYDINVRLYTVVQACQTRSELKCTKRHELCSVALVSEKEIRVLMPSLIHTAVRQNCF